MPNYAVSNSTTITAQVATTTTPISIISVFASTIAPAPVIQLKRAKVYDILVGTNGAAADGVMQWQIQRASAGSTSAYAGYASSLALQIDAADAATANAIFVNSSAEGGYTFTAATLPWYIGVNTRASYRWVAAPGSEIVNAAVSSGGVVLRAQANSGYTSTVACSVMWSE